MDEALINQYAHDLSYSICHNKNRLAYFKSITGLDSSFVAIDFETANKSYASACAVAIVVIEHGEITLEKSWLLNPKTTIWQFTKLHGIGPSDVVNAPTLKELWDAELKEILQGKILAAHNAIFEDLVLSANGIEYPLIDFIDTLDLAREMFPNAKNHKLPTAVQSCGYYFSNHHDPLADARGCALIVLHALKCKVRIFQINPAAYTILRIVKNMTSSNIADYYKYFFYTQLEAITYSEENYLSATALRVNGEIYEKCNLIVGAIFFFILAISCDDKVGVKLRLRAYKKNHPKAYDEAVNIIITRNYPQYFFISPADNNTSPCHIITIEKVQASIDDICKSIQKASAAHMLKELDRMSEEVQKEIAPTEIRKSLNQAKAPDIEFSADKAFSQFKTCFYIFLVLILCCAFPPLIFFVFIWLLYSFLRK